MGGRGMFLDSQGNRNRVKHHYNHCFIKFVCQEKHCIFTVVTYVLIITRFLTYFPLDLSSQKSGCQQLCAAWHQEGWPSPLDRLVTPTGHP